MQSLLRLVIAKDKIYIAQNIKGSLDQVFHCFSTDDAPEFEQTADGFGPHKLSCVMRFIAILDCQIATHPGKKIVYFAGQGRLKLANAAFLLGAYMIFKHDETAQSVASRLSWLNDSWIEAFRGDAWARLTEASCS